MIYPLIKLTTQGTIKSEKFGHPKNAVIILKFEQCFLDTLMHTTDEDRMAHSVDPDHTADWASQTLKLINQATVFHLNETAKF